MGAGTLRRGGGAEESGRWSVVSGKGKAPRAEEKNARGRLAGQKARESGSAVQLLAQQAEEGRRAEQQQAGGGLGDDLQLKARERVVRRVGGSIAGYFVFHAGKRTMRLTTVNHALWLRDSGYRCRR